MHSFAWPNGQNSFELLSHPPTGPDSIRRFHGGREDFRILHSREISSIRTQPRFGFLSRDFRKQGDSRGKSRANTPRAEVDRPQLCWKFGSVGPFEREACDIAICDAEIVMRVDGEEFRWSIHLPGGAVPFSEEVFFEPLRRMVRANVSDNPTGLRILP